MYVNSFQRSFITHHVAETDIFVFEYILLYFAEIDVRPYFERQERALCVMHTVNNLLQRKLLTCQLLQVHAHTMNDHIERWFIPIFTCHPFLFLI